MPEARTEEEAIRLEWEKTKFTYQRLAESLIDAAKLFATKPPEGASEAEVAKIQAEQQRWENYLGFDKTKKPEPACFNFEKKRDYDERLDTFEARAQSGEEVKLEEVKGLLDELPLGVIWERARVLEESSNLKEYFAGRQLPEDLSEEEKAFFKKYQEFARKPYDEILKELEQAPEITPKKEAAPTLIYVADEERGKEGTVIYLKESKTVDDQEISQVTLKPPAITGPESARIFVRAPFKGTREENEEYTGMGPGTAFNWENITSLQFTDSEGEKHRIAKENLSLEPFKKEEAVAPEEREKPIFVKVAFPERAKEGTVVYIIKDLPEVDGQKITQVTLKPPAVKGPESAVLFVKDLSKGPYGESFTGMNPGTIFNWENVSSLQFVDSEGNKIRVPKENLSLEPPEEKVKEIPPYGEAPYEEEYKEEVEKPKEELEERIKPPEAKEEKPYEEIPYGEEVPYEETPYEPEGPTLEKTYRVSVAAAPRAEKEMARDVGLLERTERAGPKGIFANVLQQVRTGKGFGGKVKGFFKGFSEWYKQAGVKERTRRSLRRFWQHDMVKEYFDGRAASAAEAEIKEEKSLFVGEAEKEAHRKAMTNMARRFLPDAQEIFAEKEKTLELAGEKVVLLDPKNPEHKEIIDHLKAMAIRYAASGKISDGLTLEGFGEVPEEYTEESFEDDLHEYARQIAQKHPELLPSAYFYGDTLLEAANEMKVWLDYQASRARLENNLEETLKQAVGELSETELEVALGTAHFGAYTEAERGRLENLIAKVIEKRPVLNILGASINLAAHETTLSTAAAVATCVFKFPTRFFTTMARQSGHTQLAAFASGGTAPIFSATVGGLTALFKEAGRLKRERGTVGRWRAQEREIPPETPTAEFTRFLYDLKGIDSEIVNPLSEILEQPTLSEEDIKKAVAIIADAKARLTLNAEHQIDTLAIGLIEGERRKTDLINVLPEAQVKLKEYSQAHSEELPEGVRDTYQLIEAAYQLQLDNLLNGASSDITGEEIKGIKEQNKAFNRWRWKKASQKALIRTAQGFVIGALAQEGMHLLREKALGLEDETTPIIESGLKKLGIIKEATPPPPELGVPVEVALGENRTIFLPEGSKFSVDKAQNTLDITLPDGKVLEDLPLDTNVVKQHLQHQGLVLINEEARTFSQPEVVVSETTPSYDSLNRLGLGRPEANLSVPQGTHWVEVKSGIYDLVADKDPNLVLLDDVQINNAGQIINQAAVATQARAIDMESHFGSKTIQIGEHSETVDTSIVNWLRRVRGTAKVHRDGWWDYKTPYPGPSEGSELGLRPPEIDAQGNVIQRFIERGPATSSQVPGTLDVKALIESGKAKLIITPSAADKTTAFAYDYLPGKGAFIPRNHPGASLFEGKTYNGYAVEIAQVTGEGPEGLHIMPIASYLGEKAKQIITKTAVPEFAKVPDISLELKEPITRLIEGKVYQAAYGLPKIVEKITEWPPTILPPGRRALEMEKEEVVPPVPPYPEYPEYEEYYPEYPEYGAEVYEEYPPEEYEVYVPYYERIYKALEVPEEERKELRKKAPPERLKVVTEKAKVTLEEKPYPEQVEELAAQLGIKLEEEKKPEKPLDLRKEAEATMKFPEHSKEQTRKIFFTPDPLAGGDGHLIWQGICYGKPSKKPDRELFRGYLQVDPTDIPLAIGIMHELAKKRIRDNKSTELKWLIGTRDPESDIGKYEDYIGNYTRLEETEPRAAIYTETDEEILEIVRALAQDPRWQAIEEKRKASPRRPGVNAFKDRMGQEWRSLNYNEKPGYSEDEAKDPDWRERKIGTPTIFLEAKEKRGIEGVSQVIDEIIQNPKLKNKAKELAGQAFAEEVFEDVSPEIINNVFEQTLRATFNPGESGFDIINAAETTTGSEDFQNLIPQIQTMLQRTVKRGAGETESAYQKRVSQYTYALSHLLTAKGVDKDWLNLPEDERFSYLQAIISSYDVLFNALSKIE